MVVAAKVGDLRRYKCPLRYLGAPTQRAPLYLNTKGVVICGV